MLRVSKCLAGHLKAQALWLKFLTVRLNVLALCLTLLGSGTSLDDSTVSPPVCSDGACVINVIARNLIVAPCVGYSVLVAYSQSSPATLIQCSNPAHEEENKLFVYNRKSPAAKSFVMEGSRFLRPDSLQSANDDGISSGFGKVKLCAESQSEQAESGDLLIAEKQPGNSDTRPYCYRISNVKTKNGAVEILDSNGHSQPAASKVEANRWTRIRTKLAPYVKAD